MLLFGRSKITASVIMGLCTIASGRADAQVINEQSHVRYSDQNGSSINGLYYTYHTASTQSASGFVFSTSGAPRASGITITFVASGNFKTDNTIAAGPETITFYDYGGNIQALSTGIDPNGNPSFNSNTWADLSSGTSYGSATLNQADGSAMPSFTVQLNQAFVDQYNTSRTAADQRVVLGAALTSYDTGKSAQGFWASTGAGTASFLTVQAASAAPEPSAWALMIFGFGIVGYPMRRRRIVYGNMATAV